MVGKANAEFGASEVQKGAVKEYKSEWPHQAICSAQTAPGHTAQYWNIIDYYILQRIYFQFLKCSVP